MTKNVEALFIPVPQALWTKEPSTGVERAARSSSRGRFGPGERVDDVKPGMIDRIRTAE